MLTPAAEAFHGTHRKYPAHSGRTEYNCIPAGKRHRYFRKPVQQMEGKALVEGLVRESGSDCGLPELFRRLSSGPNGQSGNELTTNLHQISLISLIFLLLF